MRQNILIAASCDVLRVGLAAVFSKNSRVARIDEVDTYQNLKTYLYRSDQGSRPDLIIVDQTLSPDFSDLPRGSFVIIAPQFDILTLREAHRHGARGYVLESIPEKMLLNLLDSSDPFFLIEPTVIPNILERLFTSNTRALIYVDERQLTPREKEIVNLLRSGVDRPTIAKKLCIAENTLKTHIKNIASKC